MAIIRRRHGELLYLADEAIGAPHAFTTRRGGVSRGIYSSLNLGVNRGDNQPDVLENYDRICALLGTKREELVFSRQVHGNQVRIVSREDRLGDIFSPVPYEADGLITSDRGVPLIIFTADCIPILLWDRRGGAVGAVHAGWRSTVLDIAGKAVSKMVHELGCRGEDICAAIGPGIGFCCFETGSEVPEAVRALLGKEGEEFISDKGEKSMVDLKGVNRQLLIQAGLLPLHIATAEDCTMCCHETYWSHRITQGHRGSQASLIMSR